MPRGFYTFLVCRWDGASMLGFGELGGYMGLRGLSGKRVYRDPEP